MAGKKKVFIIVSLIIVIATASTGYYLWNKPAVNVSDADGVKASAASLYKTFSTDSLLAKKEYDQQIVEVTGVVNSTSKNQQNQAVVLLNTGMEGGNINCTLEGKAEHIKTGDSVIIKGICNGLGQGDADLGILGDVYLIRCYQVN
jgi:tRNA_anti-like